MEPITTIRSSLIKPVDAGTGKPDSAQGGSNFGELIGNAIKQLDQVQKQADAAALQVANGQGADLHNALITVEEASLAFQLAMQVRNKVVEGYQEVMRMQV